MAWIAITRSNSPGSVSATLSPRLAIPAACTSMSMAPKSAITASTMASSSATDSTDGPIGLGPTAQRLDRPHRLARPRRRRGR